MGKSEEQTASPCLCAGGSSATGRIRGGERVGFGALTATSSSNLRSPKKFVTLKSFQSQQVAAATAPQPIIRVIRAIRGFSPQHSCLFVFIRGLIPGSIFCDDLAVGIRMV
jgi:hypothetical protein